MKGLLSMGLDKIAIKEISKLQQSDACPKALKQIEPAELVGDVSHFLKMGKEDQEERKAYGKAFSQKYFGIFEPLLTQYLLMKEHERAFILTNKLIFQ